jgi:hypothetical protein
LLLAASVAGGGMDGPCDQALGGVVELDGLMAFAGATALAILDRIGHDNIDRLTSKQLCKTSPRKTYIDAIRVHSHRHASVMSVALILSSGWAPSSSAI